MKKNIFLITIITLPISTLFPKSKKPHVDTHTFRVKEFNNFLEELAFKESSNKWDTVNKIGYIGKYQFGKQARDDIGVKEFSYIEFKKNPNIWNEKEQDKAVRKFMKKNHKYLNYYFNLDTIISKTITTKENTKYYKKSDYTEITYAGLYASCHLSGIGNVKNFLLTEGNYNYKDKNNVSTFDYLKYFSKFKIKPLL